MDTRVLLAAAAVLAVALAGCGGIGGSAPEGQVGSVQVTVTSEAAEPVEASVELVEDGAVVSRMSAVPLGQGETARFAANPRGTEFTVRISVGGLSTPYEWSLAGCGDLELRYTYAGGTDGTLEDECVE